MVEKIDLDVGGFLEISTEIVDVFTASEIVRGLFQIFVPQPRNLNHFLGSQRGLQIFAFEGAPRTRRAQQFDGIHGLV